jgi:hypothetical protein
VCREGWSATCRSLLEIEDSPLHTAFAGLLRRAEPDHTLSYVAMVDTGSAVVIDERRGDAPAGRLAPMTRVLVFRCRPMHLSPHAAEKRLRVEVSGVLADSATAQIQITTLSDASPAWCRAWDHLIALGRRDGACAGAAVASGVCADVLGELPQLRMQPNVVVATDERTVVRTQVRS